MLIIKTRIRSRRCLQAISRKFDMAKISDRLDYEILDCGISKVKLAKEIGVSRDLVICVFHMICTGMDGKGE